MQIKPVQTNGFTIVEIIVIIVIITILITITVFSYDAVLNNSRSQAVSSDLQTVNSKITRFKSDTGAYPINTTQFNTIEKSNTSGKTVFTYTYNASNATYCLRATGYEMTFHILSSNPKVHQGNCPS